MPESGDGRPNLIVPIVVGLLTGFGAALVWPRPCKKRPPGR